VTPTRSKEREDAWLPIETTDGPHTLSIRTDGRSPVRLYGVVLERDIPGVVYDSLGMVGGRAERLLAAEREHIQRQLKHRHPNLVILAFGGNEAVNRWLHIARYERNLRKVVNHVCLPRNQTACLLFAPLDQGERDERGNITTIAKLPEIVDVQRRVAREQGCAFFDTYAAMGGKNAMRAWYRQRPRLATSDFQHATPAGYERIGNMFYKAVLKGFADYLVKLEESHSSK
jgi:lysophospholipase L1-like esterase